MGYGYRYVLGAVLLIAVLFAGLTLVPTAINQWLDKLGHAVQGSAPVLDDTGAVPADEAGALQATANSASSIPTPTTAPPPVRRNTGKVSKPPRKFGPGRPGSSFAGTSRPARAPASSTPLSQPSAPSGGAPNINQVLRGQASPAPGPSWSKLALPGTNAPNDGQASPGLGWRVAQYSTILRKAPGGEGYRAPTASLALLIIVGGSRVWAIRQEGNWMLVRSPARTLGWVEAQAIAFMSPELEQLYYGKATP
jgi:hypothetical protein